MTDTELTIEQRALDIVKQELNQYLPKQIDTVLALLEDGNTVPFIARYRKDQTGSLDEVQIREIEERYRYLVNFEKRKDEVIRLIDEQEKLTDDILKDLMNAKTLTALEDIYRPFKQKKRTKATIAKEAGLEPFALWLLMTTKDSVEEKDNEAVSEEKTDEVTTGEETLSVDNITDEKEVADKVEERAEQILEKQEPEDSTEDSTGESEETNSTEEGNESSGNTEEDTAVEAEEGSEETDVSQDSFHDILTQQVTFTEDTIQHMLQLGNENYTPSIGQAISSANQIIGRKANFVFDKLGSHDLDFAIAVPLQEKLKLVTKNTPARGFFSWFKRDPSSSYVFVKDGYIGICLAKGQFYGFRKFSDRTIWLDSFVAEADLFRKAYKAVLEDVKYWNKYRAAFAAKCKELAKKYTFYKDANRIAYELDYLILDIVPNLGKYASGLDYVNTGTFPANDKTMVIENIAVPSDDALNQLRELEKEAYVAFSQSITMPPADSRVTQYEDFFTFSDLIMEAFGVNKEEAYAMVYHGIFNINGPTNYFLTNTNNSVFTFLYILTCFSKVAHLVTLGGKVYHSTLSEFYDMVNVEDNIK